MADHEQRTLVVIFLRGGLDGLNAVVPHFEDEYYEKRPSLSLQAPKAGVVRDGLLPLDERFALNPGLGALLPAFRDGRLAVIQALGSDDMTRSHFEAQDQMDHGSSYHKPLPGGWIARWLHAAGERGALSAVALGKTMPESLRGAPTAAAIESLDDVGMKSKSGDSEGFSDALGALYGESARPRGKQAPHVSLVRKAGRDALSTLARLEEVSRDPGTGGDYPRTKLGRTLSDVERLIRKDLGLRVTAIDHGGFDTHFGQKLLLEDRLKELGDAMAAFDKALGSLRDRVTTVCITEFGRTSSENASLGTDHGRASAGFVLGGGVRGGRVVAKWPGMKEEQLDGGDLRVTTEYRNLLWEILSRRFGATDSAAVFPGLQTFPVDVMT